MKFTSLPGTVAALAAIVAASNYSNAALLRGDRVEPSQHRLLSEDKTDIQLCAGWDTAVPGVTIQMMFDNGDTNPSCSLDVGSKTSGCCTLQGTTSYSTNDSIRMQNFDTKVIFTNFQVLDKDGNTLRTMDKFWHSTSGNNHSGCGLSDEHGQCDDSGTYHNVYYNIKIGSEQCQEGKVHLSHSCSGHNKFTCSNGC